MTTRRPAPGPAGRGTRIGAAAARSAEHTRAVLELRRSSAASAHTPRPRKGTRAAARTKALRDQE